MDLSRYFCDHVHLSNTGIINASPIPTPLSRATVLSPLKNLLDELSFNNYLSIISSHVIALHFCSMLTYRPVELLKKIWNTESVAFICNEITNLGAYMTTRYFHETIALANQHIRSSQSTLQNTSSQCS